MPPLDPWREVPFIQDSKNEEPRPFNPNGERMAILADPALVWLHVLDELLKPVSIRGNKERPWEWKVAGEGAVGGLAVDATGTPDPLTHLERRIAEHTTVFVSRRDNLQSIKDWQKLSFPPVGEYFLIKKIKVGGEEEWVDDPKTETKATNVRYNGKARYLNGKTIKKDKPQQFKFSKLFFEMYSRKKRAPYLLDGEARDTTCSCYDVAATNKAYARMLGSNLEMSTDQTNSDLRPKFELWGTKGKRGERARDSTLHFKYHSYNRLFNHDDTRVYDALVLPVRIIGGREREFPVVGIASPAQAPRGGPLTLDRYRELVFTAKSSNHDNLVPDQELRIR